MLDDTAPSTTTDGTTSVTNKVASGEGAETQASTKPVRKRAPRKKAPSAEPSANSETGSVVEAEASSQPATKKASARKAPAKKTAAKKGAVNQETANEATGTVESGANDQAVPAKRTKKAKSQTDDGGAVAATKPKRAYYQELLEHIDARAGECVLIGDSVRKDETLVELETDKVSVEVSAPEAGTLTDVVATEGSTVIIGALLGRLWATATKVSLGLVIATVAIFAALA